MNPLLTEALGSIVRWALAIGAGWLVNEGIWTQADATKYVAALALALIAIGWSLYQKYGMRSKLVTALAAPAGKTEAQIEHLVAFGETPKVTTPKDAVPVPAPKP